ncbi:DUF2786 domain-containing protein [Novacetimonas sp. GS1]|uniref:DUF2786 domain-containing protein n=1 Tax=Novacetimonas sp. GS1 TaxID=3119990 RepID=UPI002FCD48B5
MSQKIVMARIRKLLALSKSGNPHEAAVALERAQQLMREHVISEDDLELSGIGAFRSHLPGTAKLRPAQWQGLLAGMICRTFGVRAMFVVGKGAFRFYGRIERAEPAAYTHAVLGRQLREARSDFLRNQNKRIKRTTKIARADSFAEGWIYVVRSKAQALSIPATELQLIETWAARECGTMDTVKTRKARDVRGSGGAFMSGAIAGQSAQLHTPMRAGQQPLALGRG